MIPPASAKMPWRGVVEADSSWTLVAPMFFASFTMSFCTRSRSAGTMSIRWKMAVMPTLSTWTMPHASPPEATKSDAFTVAVSTEEQPDSATASAATTRSFFMARSIRATLRHVKYVCAQCERLVPVEDFRLDGATLVVRCPKCGAETRAEPGASALSVPAPDPVTVPRPSPSAPRPVLTRPTGAHSNEVVLRSPTADAVASAAKSVGNAFEVPPGLCVKCLTPVVAGKNECPSCGNPYDKQPELPEVPEWLKTSWVELLAHWDDAARHDKLRKQAVERQELASIGRLYRVRLARHPNDPIATLGRDEVLRLALLPSLNQPPPQKAAPEDAKWKWVLVAAVFLVVAGVLVAFAWNLLKA